MMAKSNFAARENIYVWLVKTCSCKPRAEDAFPFSPRKKKEEEAFPVAWP